MDLCFEVEIFLTSTRHIKIKKYPWFLGKILRELSGFPIDACHDIFFFLFPQSFHGITNKNLLAAHLEQPSVIALPQRAPVYSRSQDVALF